MSQNAYSAVLQPLIDDLEAANKAGESLVASIGQVIENYHHTVSAATATLHRDMARVIAGPAAAPPQLPPDIGINPATGQPYPPGHDMPAIARRKPAYPAQAH